MSLMLRYRTPDGRWAAINLSKMGAEGATLGRGKEQAQVVISDKQLSRRHCRFLRQGLFYSIVRTAAAQMEPGLMASALKNLPSFVLAMLFVSVTASSS